MTFVKILRKFQVLSALSNDGKSSIFCPDMSLVRLVMLVALFHFRPLWAFPGWRRIVCKVKIFGRSGFLSLLLGARGLFFEFEIV